MNVMRRLPSLTRGTARVWGHSRTFLMRLEEWISTIERAINAAVDRAIL